MSRNIKEIGKELLGKSLNSFHRKTGLTQLEENNKMQDGILDGILSQVDDAYIEKTEQSNVIPLDGSGDGVVVVDSIEGNTMVNLNLENKTITRTSAETGIQYRNFNVVGKPNTVYTLFINITKNTTEGTTPFSWGVYLDGATSGDNNLCAGSVGFKNIQRGAKGVFLIKFTSRSNLGINPQIVIGMHNDWQSSYEMEIKDVILLEGDWTNKEIPSMFEGLQSSFEENLEDDKYKIEILSNNKNLFNNEIEVGTINADNGIDTAYSPRARTIGCINVYENTQYTIKLFNPYHINRIFYYDIQGNYIGNLILDSNQSTFTTPKNTRKLRIVFKNTTEINITQSDIDVLKSSTQLEKGGIVTSYTPNKYNKIKLLLNEPLRATKQGKDIMCVKDSKLMVERNCGEIILNGSENWNGFVIPSDGTVSFSSLRINNLKVNNGIDYLVCDKFPTVIGNQYNYNREMIYTWSNGAIYIHITTSKLSTQNIQGFKTWLQNNPVKVVYQLEEPVYEEVLNEYGEPIILEGYENGTIYIDSTIVPTASVRYTPKMESFKTLNEVSNNNTMLTNDINDNIIPYLMDVDLMIMEKEMALPSQINIRKMEVLGMTSMQKRTQDMLERLIKGKTLTEQECKTRITTYLNAGKITDAQAEELNFLIDEIYA